MASDGANRSGLLTAGGVLSIIGGVFEAIAGGMVVGIAIKNIILGPPAMLFMRIPWVQWGEIVGGFFPAIFIIVGVVILVLGVIGIAGGISAVNRKSFGLSLAGAICILPTALLGILAIIFIALGKREFGAKV